MNIEKFTLKAQEALQEAKSIAERKHHQQIDVEHLLLALLEQKEGQLPHQSGGRIPLPVRRIAEMQPQSVYRRGRRSL